MEPPEPAGAASGNLRVSNVTAHRTARGVINRRTAVKDRARSRCVDSQGSRSVCAIGLSMNRKFKSRHYCERCAKVALLDLDSSKYDPAIRPLYKRSSFIATPDILVEAKNLVCNMNWCETGCREFAIFTIGLHDRTARETQTFESRHYCEICARLRLLHLNDSDYDVAIRPLNKRPSLIATPEMIFEAKSIVCEIKRKAGTFQDPNAVTEYDLRDAWTRTNAWEEEQAKAESLGSSKIKLGLPRQNYGDDT